MDITTYAAAVGAAKRYTDEHSGSGDAVKYTEQTLTTAQKTQARTNIGAGTSSFSGSYGDLTNAPPLVKGSGTGGDMIGGTGVNQNSTRYTNSVAYGNLAAAIKDYAIAFGNRAFAGTNRGGKHAVAIGDNVRAEKDYEWAIGKCNQSNSDTAFSIGDGTSDNDRHNLMELKTDGKLLLNGNAVKTEGGDDKLWLEQICAVYVNPAASSNTQAYNIGYGFKELFTASSTVTTISFSVNQAAISYNLYRAFKFGDFIGYREQSNSTTIYVKATSDSSMTDGKIHVKSGEGMFNGCGALTALDLSLFDTSKTKGMSNMFSNCGALTALDLSTFDTSNVETMYGMFGSCFALTSLDLSSFDMSNVTAYGRMFENDTALTTLKTPKINPHDDIPLPITLYSQNGTAYTNLPVTTGTSIELRQSWT